MRRSVDNLSGLSEAGVGSSDLNTAVTNITNAFGNLTEQQQAAININEAEKQRLWEQYMSNTAYQRQMADLEAAGLNPLLMFGYGSGSSSGASTPSGSSAKAGGDGNNLFKTLISGALKIASLIVNAKTGGIASGVTAAKFIK